MTLHSAQAGVDGGKEAPDITEKWLAFGVDQNPAFFA
jgi:hypothetical protein